MDSIQKKIKSYFPYQFTNDQQHAIDDIRRDLASGEVMQRLIQGEVSSGKTAVMLYAAIGLALQGKRTLIFAPTTILADQHFNVLKNMGWDDVGLWIGGTHPKGHWPNIVIGTHALLYQPDFLKTASLICIDEFQRTGVEQRAILQSYNPHLLLLSASPLPRTLAATVFGGLDISTIRQLPIQRGTIISRWILSEKREAMWEIVEQELIKGHQVYAVFPRISGDENIVSAERGFKELSERFSEYCVKLLTGRASNTDKIGVMKDFKNGSTQILVSTVLSEIGLDCPNATVSIIEGADKFGLTSLHQIRGRVCRSENIAFCFLVSDSVNEASIARLDIITRTNDGFEIAEADLRLRGPGELFSTRQHGLPDLKFASLVDDYDLMIQARDLVQSGDVGNGVREMMQLKYGDNLQLGGVT